MGAQWSGAAGWIRTNLLLLFTQALIHLSYDGETESLWDSGESGADSESRTPDIELARIALCLLSYDRRESLSGCPQLEHLRRVELRFTG
jgi:hypothetical protein